MGLGPVTEAQGRTVPAGVLLLTLSMLPQTALSTDIIS